MPTLAAHLELAETKALPGARIRYSVVNDGPVPIMLGEHYSLEHLSDRGWEGLPTLMFHLVGYYLPEGARHELDLRIPEDAHPGRYRIRKRLDADRDPRPGSEWLRGHKIEPIELTGAFDVVRAG